MYKDVDDYFNKKLRLAYKEDKEEFKNLFEILKYDEFGILTIHGFLKDIEKEKKVELSEEEEEEREEEISHYKKFLRCDLKKEDTENFQDSFRCLAFEEFGYDVFIGLIEDLEKEKKNKNRN